MSHDYQLPNDGLVRLNDVLKVIPVSPSTWYRGINEGVYPKPRKIGPKKRAAAYCVHEIRRIMQPID